MTGLGASAAVAVLVALLAGCQSETAAAPGEPTALASQATLQVSPDDTAEAGATATPAATPTHPTPEPTQEAPTPQPPETVATPPLPTSTTATLSPAPTPAPTITATATPVPTLAQIVSQVSNATVKVTAGRGFGSGFIIDPTGYVLTAGHVVAGQASVTVTLVDGTELQGLVIGRDEIRDLGMIKIAGHTDLPWVELGNVEDIAMGVEVLVLGYSSFNEGISITSGVVSDFVEHETEEFSYLQTDAGFYVGQSGGPVISRSGQVVGVVSIGRFTNFQAPAGWAIAMDEFTLWMVNQLKAGEQILAPVEAAIGRNRDNPAPIGHTVRVHGIAFDGSESIHDITVVRVVRGEDTEAVLQAAYRLNPPPPPGVDFLLVQIHIKYVQGPDGRTDWMHQVDFGMLSTDGVKYRSFLGVVPPTPFLSARLYPGSEYTSWTVWEIDETDEVPMLVFGLDWNTRGKAFFSTIPDTGPKPADETAEDQSNDTSGGDGGDTEEPGTDGGGGSTGQISAAGS